MERIQKKIADGLRSSKWRTHKLKEDDDLHEVEEQVNQYRDVLQQVSKKITRGTYDEKDKDKVMEKRLKKVHEYVLGLQMENSAKELPDGVFKDILATCGKLEKTLADEIVKHDMNIENDVSFHLNTIINEQIAAVKKQKSVVTKCHQDHETAKRNLLSASTEKTNEAKTKLTQLKDDQEELQKRLEKERDIYASCMYDVLAEEENMASFIVKYITNQELLYKSALAEIQNSKKEIDLLLGSSNKKVFSTKLEDHLSANKRKISYVIQLCVCYLLLKGMNEEGLLRVGCGNSKLKRMKSAIDANVITLPIPVEYQDVHLIASILKSYLRSLPEPLLTYKYYNEFLKASQMHAEKDRKSAILKIIQELEVTRPDYYTNLRYLMRFLSKLAENNATNKMSTQNIAIVMSPNLLWARDSNDECNYAIQVNSTASGNAIVELLVADWSYFFGEDNVDFFGSMTQEKILGFNGEYASNSHHDYHLESNRMTRSFNAQHQSSNFSTSTVMFSSSENSGKHSRTGSHDTSQIIVDQMKKSQSNSSLSDHSSPTHGSPKPNQRNKKKLAPTPPPPPTTGPHIQSKYEELAFIDSEEAHVDESKGTIKAARSTENLLRPEKPPRPAFSHAESQTLHRGVNRNIMTKIDRPSRPVAAPRTAFFAKPSNSNEEEEVVLRQSMMFPVEKPSSSDKHLSGEKPVIPERPTNIKRASYKGPNSTDGSDSSEQNVFKTPLAKSNSVQGNEKPSVSANSGVVPTVLERTKVYNIEKEHAELFVKELPPPLVLAKDAEGNDNENKENSQNINCKFLHHEIYDNNNTTMSASTTSLNVDTSTASPSSPRSFDAKSQIPKRPQVPPPAAPPSRPKSNGDSTNL